MYLILKQGNRQRVHNVKRRRTQISDEGRLSPKHSSEFFSSLLIVNYVVQYEGHRFIHRKLIGDILPWKAGPERVSFFCQDKKS